MSIKFIGVRGKNRIRLKPRAESTLIVDNSDETQSPNGTPELIYDDSYGICLSQSEVSCVGAPPNIGKRNGFAYDVGWTVFLNGLNYGHFDRNHPMDYTGSSDFNWMINIYLGEDNTLWFENSTSNDLRVTLVPDSKPNMSPTWQFVDYSFEDGINPSEHVLVEDNGTIMFCLSRQPIGSVG